MVVWYCFQLREADRGAGWVLTCGGRGAGFTGLVPGLAHVVGTAAHLLGHVEGQLVLTGVVEVTVAHTLPHVCGDTASEAGGQKQFCPCGSPDNRV